MKMLFLALAMTSLSAYASSQCGKVTEISVETSADGSNYQCTSVSTDNPQLHETCAKQAVLNLAILASNTCKSLCFEPAPSYGGFNKYTLK